MYPNPVEIEPLPPKSPMATMGKPRVPRINRYLLNIRRGDAGMKCVVAYLQSIHWESAGVPFDLAQIKLTRVVDELQHLCASNVKRPGGSASAPAKENEQPAENEEPAAPKRKNAAFEASMDKIFAATVNTKRADNEFRPRRKNPQLSEESEDDFDQVDVDKPATPAGTRKILVVEDGDASSTEQPPTTAPPKKKKAKKATAPPATAPKVSVIEIDDESDDSTRKRTKRGPKNVSREHFHSPRAFKENGRLRWEFKCKHCAKSITFTRTVGRDEDFDDEPKQPALGNLSTHLKDHGGPSIPIPGATPLGETRGISAASAKIMEDFLREGKLNPAVNPTQKGFLTVFSAWILEADDPEVVDYYLPNKDLPFHYDPEEDPNLHDLESEQFPAVDADDEEEVEAEVMTELVEELVSLSPLQTAIDQWVFEREALRPLLLKDDQWKMLFGLGDILETFTQVTLQMSKSTTPTLPWVIPMYEKMLKHLTDARDNVGILEPLRVAAAAGLTKLTTYYEKARGCQFNVIATMLHPSLGLSWFGKLAHDGKERENHARVLFTHAYEAYKKVYDDEKAAATRAHQPHPPRRTGSSSSFLDDVCMADDDDEALPSAGSIDLIDLASQ
ncbi:hypothetical protein FB451DRAFT_1373925 [Mycena latifolia]|nr:hypothetical protein FB451DRAFT_1373925 [Mycena latifolia]